MKDIIQNEFNSHIKVVNLLHNLTDKVASSAQLCINCLKYGGKILVRGGKFEILEGRHKYERNIVIEFPSLAIVKEFYNSKEYQHAKSFRDGKANFNGIVIEGFSTE